MKNDMNRFLTSLLGVLLGATLLCSNASAQTYPNKPIKLIVPFSPGGPNDTAARVIAPQLAERLKQPVVIENIGGAGGRIGSKAAAKAAPDGYTLMMGGTNLNVVLPALHANLDYNPVGDFVALGAVATDAMIVAINPSLPVRTVQEFVQYSKANPGKVNAGSVPGIGPHFVIELFKRRTGANLAFIPYKGASPAIQDVIGGHLQMTITNKAVLLPMIQAGKLRALAVTSPARLADMPDVPTLRESGVLGVPSINWYGVLAPASTPAPIVATLRAAIQDVVNSPRSQDSFLKLGLDPRVGKQDFSAALAEQLREWIEIVKEAGIQAE